MTFASPILSLGCLYGSPTDFQDSDQATWRHLTSSRASYTQDSSKPQRPLVQRAFSYRLSRDVSLKFVAMTYREFEIEAQSTFSAFRSPAASFVSGASPALTLDRKPSVHN
jgi:hypothetical protein